MEKRDEAVLQQLYASLQRRRRPRDSFGGVDASGGGLFPEAYVLRAEALHAMGQTEKAIKHLKEALSRDPDNAPAARTLKRLRRLVVDMERLKQTIAGAMSKRKRAVPRRRAHATPHPHTRARRRAN